MVLRRDVPLDIELDSLGVHPDDAEVRRLFDFLEIRALYDRLRSAVGMGGGPAAPSGEVLTAELRVPANAAEAVAALQQIAQADVAATWSGGPWPTTPPATCCGWARRWSTTRPCSMPWLRCRPCAVTT
jgi:hypothetical protein